MIRTDVTADDIAATPVVGVALMVSITVTFTAVTGAFVLTASDSLQQTAPTTSFEVEYVGDDELRVTHAGGDSVPAGRVSFAGDVAGEGSWADRSGGEWAPAEPIMAGDSITVSIDAEPRSIRVVWHSSDGNRSATLAIWTP